MRKIEFIIIILLIVQTFGISQVISSKKVPILINNLDVPQETDEAPEIILVSPESRPGDTVKTDRQLYYVIGRVTDQNEIASVFINAIVAKLSDDRFFNEEVLLNEGLNEINIMAVDEENNLSKFTFYLDYAIRFRSATELGVLGKYYALIIGIESYNDPDIFNLNYPIRDANKFYSVLTDRYTFEERNVKLLENPSRNDIIDALDAYSNIITKNDNLLIFYAGHGFWDDDAKIGYWLPADAKLTSKSAWFRNSTLQDYLREIESKHTLLITDACFGGSIFKSRAISNNAPLAIKKLYDLPSRKAMTSGTLTEVPDESSFVKYLINKLEENQEKYLSSEQLFSSFRIAVINNSLAIPQFGEIRDVGDEGGDFIFIKKD